MRRLAATAALVALLAGLPAAPAQAITFGTLDGDAHPWVGALVLEVEPGVKDWVCTGTLVSPKVFVTAAHCLAWAPIPAHDAWVTFDPAFSDEATLYRGTFTIDPQYGTAPRSDYHDLAVVVLDEAPPVPHASLPPAGWLDGAAARSSRYTAVGYGRVRDDKTKGPHTGYYDGQRRWVTQSFQSLTRTVATFSMNPAIGNGGSCYGDSGGPHFVGDTRILVAITVTGDAYCRATDRAYRIDTPASLAFIRAFIAP